MTDHYILDDAGNPVLVADVLEWARWFENGDKRRLARTALPDGTEVSTVFLGLDHRFSGDGPPVLWETLVFTTDGSNGEMRRYTSRDEALAGHAEIVASLSAPAPPAPEEG